jgi:oxygen-independent coproporphyrinogen-3 oxidase
VLDHETRRLERMLLELRLSDGLALDVLDDVGRKAVPDLVLRGLIAPSGTASGPGRRLTLTRTGRLLADAVLRDLVP